MENENEIKIGRPSLGVTKKVSITLPEEIWQRLEDLQDKSDCSSRSEFLREILTWVSNNARH